LFLDGTLYRGAIGNAGEIGHCVVVEDGRPCKCGSNGCLEAYAAGPAIVQNYVEQGGSPEIDGMPADAKRIAQCAREGDAAAVRAFILEGQYLGKMIATAANLFNPQKVVIGGGISLAFDIYGGILKRTVSDYLYIKANPGLEILPTPLGYYGGLLGAAAVAFVGPDKYQAR
jgi:glucokinase